jgi:hypothetical protein
LLPVRVPRVQAVALPALLVVLAGTAGYALKQELTAKPAEPAAAAHRALPEQKGLEPAEEAYAEALLPIQQAVAVAALRMSFAGLSYKTEHNDTARLEGAVRELHDQFRTALEGAGRLEAPASLRRVRDQYVEALTLYQAASAEMMRFVHDSSEEHLIEAQGMSQRASENVLRVGDILWPAAHKPH